MALSDSIKSIFFSRRVETFYCLECANGIGYSLRTPCPKCGRRLSLKVKYVHLKDWVERTLDVVCIIFVVIIPFLLYYDLIKSYANKGIFIPFWNTKEWNY